jgi:hypothetical protein
MEDLVKKLYKMVVEVRKISEANNELLGFICSKIAPADTVVQKEIKDIDVADMFAISMEMSEIFEKYNITADEYGLS